MIQSRLPVFACVLLTLLPVAIGREASSPDLRARLRPDLAATHALVLRACAELEDAHAPARALLTQVLAAVESRESELEDAGVDEPRAAGRIAETEERLWLVIDALLPAGQRHDLCTALPQGVPPPVSAIEHALHLPGVTSAQAREILELLGDGDDGGGGGEPRAGLLSLLSEEQRRAFAALPRGVTPERLLAAPDQLFRGLDLGGDTARRIERLSRRSRRRARRITDRVGELRRTSRYADAAEDPAEDAVAEALADIRAYRAETLLHVLSPGEVIEWVRGPREEETLPPVRRVARVAPAPRPFPGQPTVLVAGTNTLVLDGRERRLELFLPAAPAGAPVLFLWHGLGDNAHHLARAFRADELAARHGAIVVAPQSSGIFVATEWGYFGGDPQIDLSFFDGILSCLDRQFDIDNERVYTTGFSAGALWSTYLLMHRTEYLAAAALFSGGIDPVFLPYSRLPVHMPVLSIHGGPEDAVGVVNFHRTATELEKLLRRDGHFVVSYDHGGSHEIPFDPDTFAMPFLFAHSLREETLPYEQSLGEDWPAGATIR